MHWKWKPGRTKVALKKTYLDNPNHPAHELPPRSRQSFSQLSDFCYQELVDFSKQPSFILFFFSISWWAKKAKKYNYLNLWTFKFENLQNDQWFLPTMFLPVILIILVTLCKKEVCFMLDKPFSRHLFGKKSQLECTCVLLFVFLGKGFCCLRLLRCSCLVRGVKNFT